MPVVNKTTFQVTITYILFKYIILRSKQCWINRCITRYNILNLTINLRGRLPPRFGSLCHNKWLGIVKVKWLRNVPLRENCSLPLELEAKYTNWANGRPVYREGGGNRCLCLYKSGTDWEWNDCECKSEFPFVCLTGLWAIFSLHFQTRDLVFLMISGYDVCASYMYVLTCA